MPEAKRHEMLNKIIVPVQYVKVGDEVFNSNEITMHTGHIVSRVEEVDMITHTRFTLFAHDDYRGGEKNVAGGSMRGDCPVVIRRTKEDW